jgi:hypothetical protein
MKSIGLLAKWLNIEGYMLYENERLDMWFHISMTPTYRGCLNTFSLLHDEPVQFFQPLQSAFHSNHDGAISLVKLIIEDVLRVAGVRNDPLRLLAGPEYPLNTQNNNFTEVERQIEHGLRLKSDGEHNIVNYLHQICVNWQLDAANTWEVISVKLEKECLRAEDESKQATVIESASPSYASANESPLQSRSKRRRPNEDRDRFAAELRRKNSSKTWFEIAVETDGHSSKYNLDWCPFFDNRNKPNAVQAVQMAVKRFNERLNNS